MSIAANIKAAEATVPASARLGRKIFISEAHKAVAPRMSLDAFKSLLVEEHLASRIHLSRCDLGSVGTRELISASETNHPSGAGTWHFVSVA